jgi:hypothetical protein
VASWSCGHAVTQSCGLGMDRAPVRPDADMTASAAAEPHPCVIGARHNGDAQLDLGVSCASRPDGRWPMDRQDRLDRSCRLGATAARARRAAHLLGDDLPTARKAKATRQTPQA